MANDRNYGIDLLKIIMMFLIVCGHVIWHGGVWNRIVIYNQFNITGEFVRIIDIVSSCAVNCYAMATGYLLFDSSCNRKKMFMHWEQVEMYSVMLFIIFGSTTDFSIKNLISSFLPISRNQYWYFTSYFIVYLSAPYINKLLHGLSKKEFSALILGEILILSLVPTFVMTDVFSLNRGYSPWWMLVLYTMGAYIKCFGHELVITKRKIIICLLILSFASYTLEKVGELVCTIVLNQSFNVRDVIVGYTKIFTVLESLLWFIAFEKVTVYSINLKKVMSLLSKATFGVYLFHDNIYIRQIYSRMTENIVGWGGMLLPISLFVIGGVVELLREVIVKKCKMFFNYR